MSYQYRPGLGDAGSYQVAAKPWVSGSIDIDTETGGGGLGTEPFRIQFPTVTKWISVRNHHEPGSGEVRVGFSRNGMFSRGGGNYFTVLDSGEGVEGPPPIRIKVCEIWLEGDSTQVDVVAGLTGINCNQIPNNWSGSAGVG